MSGRSGSRLLDPDQATQYDVENGTDSASNFTGRIKVILIVLLVVAVIIGILTAIFLLTASPENVCPVHQSVSMERVQACLTELQERADLYDGNRAAGRAGYRASMEYILEALKPTRLNVTEQMFLINSYKVEGTPKLAVVDFEHSFTYQTDFVLFDGSTSGKSDGTPLTFVGEGCSLEAYQGFPAGNVALVKRGNCSFNEKGDWAFAAGASAIVVFNTDPSVLSTRMTAKIPAFSAAGWIGTVLGTFLNNTVISYEVNVTAGQVQTWNIIAETPEGDPDKRVVFGSHLDGVPAGSGINDNGSGSCMNLELALTAAKTCTPNQKLVFAWWGAEELGLLGSKNWLDVMPQEDRNKIALNLNFDMMASPNYALQVFNGSTAPAQIQKQCTLIQEQFEKFFTAANIPYALVAFTASSDYAPFLTHGIPAGGLATGAGGLKTYAQRDKFGGVALIPYDNCYHQKCDTTQNIHPYALESNLKASSSVLEIMAVETDLVNQIHTTNQVTQKNVGFDDHQKFLQY